MLRVGKLSPFFPIAFALFFLFSEPASLLAQDAADTEVGSTNAAAAGRADTYGEPPQAGVPYSNIFRQTGAPTSVESLTVPGAGAQARTENLQGNVQAQPGFRYGVGLPFLRRAFAPEDAHLKVGPVYLRVQDIAAGVLFSDNVNLDKTNRQAGAISFIRFDLSIVAQLSENTQFALALPVYFLPFKGTFGLAAPRRGLSLNTLLLPELATQVSYDTMIAGWDVVFADDFSVKEGSFSANTRDDFDLFQNENLGATDRAGRYTFGTTAATSNSNQKNIDARVTNQDFLVYSNVVSLLTERLLPSDVRLRVSAFHENLWYNTNRRGLPSTRDEGEITLASERENLRFKPYVSYIVSRTDRSSGLDQFIRLGVIGPITDQLRLRAETGLAINGANSEETFLYRLLLQHTAGPYTDESLDIARNVSQFLDEISDYARYRIIQILGPNLTADGYVMALSVKGFGGNADAQGLERKEFRTGLQLRWEFSEKTDFTIGGVYARQSGGVLGDVDTWTGRMILDYRFTDTFVMSLLYQYQKHDSINSENSYYENLVYLTLTKSFR